MNVAELREKLIGLPDDLPVVASYDTGCAQGSVLSAERGPSSEGDALVLDVD